ncbi:MAG: immunoglobulin domain-containing protein, partial [Limisphaerales bacterium]
GDLGKVVMADAIRLTLSTNQTFSPWITQHPENWFGAPGNTATFLVHANGTAPLNYQWCRNGTNIIGATTSSYTRGNVQPADAGCYSVLISNSAGSTVSSNAMLAVQVPTRFEQFELTAANGLTLTLSGTLGSEHVVEISTNLVHWNTLANIKMTNNSIEFIDSSLPDTLRFYRVTQTTGER